MGTVPFEFWSVNHPATFPDRGFWFVHKWDSGGSLGSGEVRAVASRFAVRNRGPLAARKSEVFYTHEFYTHPVNKNSNSIKIAQFQKINRVVL